MFNPHSYQIWRVYDYVQFTCDFDRFRLIVPQPWELARIAIIANRKSITLLPSSHRRTMCVAMCVSFWAHVNLLHRIVSYRYSNTAKSPKGWLKTRIFTFGVAFHFFVAGNRRHVKFNTWVGHSKSQPTDDKPSLKWAWPRHVIHFKFLVPKDISGTA